MSVEREGVVFYGLGVPRASEVGKKLDEIVEAYGGTPAPTSNANVSVSEVSSGGGERWMVVHIKGSWHAFGRGHDAVAPMLLDGQERWRQTIERALDAYGWPEDQSMPIGWHFAGNVS